MGFWMSPRMKALVDKPGYLKGKEAQTLRDLYVDGGRDYKTSIPG